MNKYKLFTAVAGLVMAAGIASAGKILIGNDEVGTYDGNLVITGQGNVKFPQGTEIDGSGGGDALNCDTNEVDEGGVCVCADGYVRDDAGDCVPDDDNNSDTGGDGTGGDSTADCSGVPEMGTRDTSWTQFSSFPQPTPSKERFTIDNNKYMAIKFTAPTTPNIHGVINTVADSHASNDHHTFAVSECPGDFKERVAQGLCRKGSSGHQFYWSTHGQYFSSTCELERGKTYFLNIRYAKFNTNGDMTDSMTCPHGSRCGALLYWDT